MWSNENYLLCYINRGKRIQVEYSRENCEGYNLNQKSLGLFFPIILFKLIKPRILNGKTEENWIVKENLWKCI